MSFSSDADPGIVYIPTKAQPIREIKKAKKRGEVKVATNNKKAEKKQLQKQKRVVRAKYTLLYDTESGSLYKVPAKMLDEIRKCNVELAKIRDNIKKANERTQDEIRNPVLMGKEELEEYCEVKGVQEPPTYEGGIPEPDPDKKTIIREFVELKTKTFLYAPQAKVEKIEGKHKFVKKALNQVVQIKESANAKNWKHDKTLNAKQIREKEIEEAKKGNVPFEIKFSSDWKVEGEGSILDLIDSSDPQLFGVLLSNPATAPTVLLDWVCERHPKLFRKKHKTLLWEKSRVFDASAEATFMRYSYGVNALEAVIDPANKKFKVESKASGRLDLVRGKVSGAWYMPNKTGYLIRNLMPLDKDYKYRDELRLIFALKGEVSGFVGAIGELGVSAIAAIEMQENYEKNTSGKSTQAVNIGIGGGLDAFAGASVEGKLIFEVLWINVVEKKQKALANIQGKIEGIAGLALKYKFQVGYDNEKKKFTLEIAAGVAVELGGAAGVKGEMDANEAILFISELVSAVDCRKVAQVSVDAFETHWKWMVALAINPGLTISTYVGKEVTEYFNNLYTENTAIRNMARDIRSGTKRYKIIIDHGAPEAKAAIITRLCQTNMIWADELQEDAVLMIIESVKSRREMENILERVLDSSQLKEGKKKVSVENGIEVINDLLDFSQETKFKKLLKYYSISF